MTHATHHHLTRTDGSPLAVWTIGPDEGTPLVLCHPAPGSGLFDPEPVSTSESGIRIIAPNRQGYGATGRADSASIARAGEDVLTALDNLGVDASDVVGWSAGGRVAMWLAANHPDRVHSLTIVGTPAPNEEVSWIPDEQMAMLDQLRSNPDGAVDQMTAMFGPMIEDPSVRTGLLAGGPADSRALLADPDLAARVAAMLDDAFAHGPEGMAADIASYTLADWGFEPTHIAARTTIFSGSEDVVVPPEHGAWYASRIPNATHVEREGWGHLVIVAAWPQILRSIES